MSSITRNIAATTVSTSVTGTNGAGPTAGWARSPRRAVLFGRGLLFGLAGAVSVAASPLPSAELDVAVSGLRNQHGAVMLCLTRRGAEDFLRCASDPERITRIVASSASGATIRIVGLTPGDYALLVIHDENRNGRLDTMLGMPREGFGFSRNPAMRFGPPHYGDVRFALSGKAHQAIKLNYLL